MFSYPGYLTNWNRQVAYDRVSSYTCGLSSDRIYGLRLPIAYFTCVKTHGYV